MKKSFINRFVPFRCMKAPGLPNWRQPYILFRIISLINIREMLFLIWNSIGTVMKEKQKKYNKLLTELGATFV